MKQGTPLKPGQGPTRRKGPRRSQPARDWAMAREKVEREGRCRICGRELPPEQLQAMHVIGRDRDRLTPVVERMFPRLFGGEKVVPWIVHPDRIVPGCAPCHDAYDHGRVDLLGKLTVAEEIQAVADSHTKGTRESGIENARVRLAPSQYRSAA